MTAVSGCKTLRWEGVVCIDVSSFAISNLTALIFWHRVRIQIGWCRHLDAPRRWLLLPLFDETMFKFESQRVAYCRYAWHFCQVERLHELNCLLSIHQISHGNFFGAVCADDLAKTGSKFSNELAMQLQRDYSFEVRICYRLQIVNFSLVIRSPSLQDFL